MIFSSKIAIQASFEASKMGLSAYFSAWENHLFVYKYGDFNCSLPSQFHPS
jgi:hypothetical protein